MISNAFVIIGCGLTLLPYYWMLLFGRLIYGMAAGGFSVFCTKFISETAPPEVRGPAGGLTQCGITFGILMPFLVGHYFNDPYLLS